MTGIELRPDGPHSDDYTESLARSFAEVVRVLNHATGSHSAAGLTCPQTIYTVLGNLAHAAAGLDQLLRQLGDYLLDTEPQMNDTGGDLAGAVIEALDFLAGAGSAAGSLSRELAGAQSAISGFYLTDPADSDDQPF